MTQEEEDAKGVDFGGYPKNGVPREDLIAQLLPPPDDILPVQACVHICVEDIVVSQPISRQAAASPNLRISEPCRFDCLEEVLQRLCCSSLLVVHTSCHVTHRIYADDFVPRPDSRPL